MVLETPAPTRIENFDFITVINSVISFEDALSTVQGDALLIDLDLAIKNKDQKPSGTLSRTGTKVFKAIGALNQAAQLMPQYRCIGAMGSHRVTERDAT